MPFYKPICNYLILCMLQKRKKTHSFRFIHHCVFFFVRLFYCRLSPYFYFSLSFFLHYETLCNLQKIIFYEELFYSISIQFSYLFIQYNSIRQSQMCVSYPMCFTIDSDPIRMSKNEIYSLFNCILIYQDKKSILILSLNNWTFYLIYFGKSLKYSTFAPHSPCRNTNFWVLT